MSKKKFKFLAVISVFILGVTLSIKAISMYRLDEPIETAVINEIPNKSLNDETKITESTLKEVNVANANNVVQLKEVNTAPTKNMNKNQKENLTVADKNIGTNDVNSIVYTNKVGTVTIQDGLVQLWQNKKCLASAEIPQPAEEVKNFSTCPIYLDTEGRIIALQTYKKDGKYIVEYTVLKENVENIFTTTPNIFIKDKYSYGILRIKDTNGEYGTWYNYINFEFADLNETLKDIKADILWLNENTIEKLNFKPYVGCSGSGYNRIYFWAIEITLKNSDETTSSLPCWVKVYTPSVPVKADRSFINEMEKEFDISEYDEKYQILIEKTKKLEAKN